MLEDLVRRWSLARLKFSSALGLSSRGSGSAMHPREKVTELTINEICIESTKPLGSKFYLLQHLCIRASAPLICL